MAKVAKALTADVGKAVITEWASQHVRVIVADALLGTDAKTAVIGRLQHGGWLEKSQRNDALIQDLELARGTGWAPSSAEAASERVYRAVADAVATHYSPGSRATIRRSLGGYSAAFPRAAGQAASGSSVASDFIRAARSYRVRGVLFGRELSPGFRITDIAWHLHPGTTNPTLLTLRVLVDGTEQSLGPFAAGIVNQALRYAADRRVVATTISPADGDAISRITYLHPVLEDTPLGCRVVEIDRLIDTFTSPSSGDTEQGQFAQQLEEISSHRLAAWRFQQIARLAEIAAFSGARCQPQRLVLDTPAPPTAAIAAHAKTVHELLDRLADSAHSTKLVEAALHCGASQSSKIGECLCDGAELPDLSQPYWFPEDHTSQVRERDPTTQTDYHALFTPASAADHIELWLHTTFAVRQDAEPRGDEPETVALDFPEHQIDLLNEVLIPSAITHYATTNLNVDYADFMRPIEQFVVAQRFMRAALFGRLGDAFPIEKLVQLERITAAYVPTQPTIRWEPADDEAFLNVLSDSGEEASQAFFQWFRDLARRHDQASPVCDTAAR